LYYILEKKLSYISLMKAIHLNFNDTSVSSADIDFAENLFDQRSVVRLVRDVLDDEQLLERIAGRSYIHALGFYKIVLMDLSKDFTNHKQKTQLRLHIWNPTPSEHGEVALPIVESLHEHSFDFVSTVISGKLENQQFLSRPLSEKERDVLEKVKKVLPTLSDEDKVFINDQVESEESARLSYIGSTQYQELNMDLVRDVERFMTLTHLTPTELKILCSIQGHYVSDRVAGERKAYKHVLKDYVALTPYQVLNLKAGDTYFHPFQMPHRLLYDSSILNSTLLITTPVPSNPEGGSLQRPTYVQKSEQHYDKIPFTANSLRDVLVNYLNFLIANQ